MLAWWWQLSRWLRRQAATFDFGFKAGLGFHILFIGVDVAYTWSTTDLWKVDTGSIKNRALSVTGVLGLP